jgi:hypothetical protein
LLRNARRSISNRPEANVPGTIGEVAASLLEKADYHSVQQEDGDKLDDGSVASVVHTPQNDLVEIWGIVT